MNVLDSCRVVSREVLAGAAVPGGVCVCVCVWKGGGGGVGGEWEKARIMPNAIVTTRAISH